MTDLAIVAIVQNEARYLPEWVRYHRAIGVEEFYLYDNDSTDDTAWTAARLGVSTIPWPGREDNPQLRAHENALAMLGHARWLAFIDPDEFIYAPAGLTEELARREKYPAVGICWACFGTSGLTEPPKSVAAYTRRSEMDLVVNGRQINTHIKSIVQPHLVRVHRPRDPHHFLCPTVDTYGSPIKGPFHEPAPTWHAIRLNHYISRSLPEAREKMAKMRVNTNNYYDFDLTDESFNAVEDDSMARFMEKLWPSR